MRLKELFSAKDMTIGSPAKRILEFSIPMLLGNIAQQLYNTADSIIVGKFVGDNALAAVGSASPILNLLLALFVGISTGAGIVVSQRFGAKDREGLSIAIGNCITRLSQLEKENCSNADETANCFGMLMGELLVYQEDLWADTLRQMGMALGRYIYLADAAIDYKKDKKKGRYNPFLAMGMEEDWAQWEQYLVLAMGRCTDYYERLPLVQDKDILDNILYSGVWVEYRRRQKGQETVREETDD